MIPHIAARELAALLEGPEPPRLLDVRETWEWEQVRLPGAELVPLSKLQEALPGLDRDASWVVYCHHGVRSLHAVGFLQTQGFGRIANLLGGIDAYAVQVDPALPRY
ncbi:MAG: rhodanese-like domain-containing protein [Candidatus Sericytochromatia bacterium]|nr:rhodanese-like domain-containing protein [Candidatus Sericytochromatia bacterium]